jgi:HEAT repeat protein
MLEDSSSLSCPRPALIFGMLLFFLSAMAAPQTQAPPQNQPAQTEKPRPPQETPKPETSPVKPVPPINRAWAVLHEGLSDQSAEKRAKAVRALALLTHNREAESAAIEALGDPKDIVRVAAATALGSMRAARATGPLEKALDDDEPEVVLAAANSLLLLKDTDSAYDVYYGVLTGNTRTSKGLVKEQLKILHDKKKMAEMGIEQGIGFIPFAGFGYEVVKTVMKSDNSQIRAAAAKKLAQDPAPATADALVAASHDKNWLVRAAAFEAISERGDKSLIPRIALSLDDEKDDVRFIAAACVAHLSDLPAKAKDAEGNP